MFGFKQRSREREARKAEEIAAVSRAAHARLCTELSEAVSALALKYCSNKAEADALIEKGWKIRAGFDAVINGTCAYGSELAEADRLVRGGAVLAQAACNMAVLTGKLDNPNTRGDICHILGFSRDGSEIREYDRQ